MIFKIIRKCFVLFTNLLIYPITFLFCKSDKYVIIGGWYGQRFADNSKYLFLYLNKYKIDLGINEVVWITKNKDIYKQLKSEGFNVCIAWSIKSIFYHLKSKYHFIDQSVFDINPYFSLRSKRINLWHGFPLKKIGFYEKNRYKLSDRLVQKYMFFNDLLAFFTPGCWRNNYVLATSTFSAKIIGSAFGFDEKKVIVSAYPRDYQFFTTKELDFASNNNIKSTIEKYKHEKKKIIGYFPTFRDNVKTLFFGFDNEQKLLCFLDYIYDTNSIIISKFHFASFQNSRIDHKSLINLDSTFDINSILLDIDILITDYSSVYFDFLLTRKPIIYFPYDLEYYKNNDRGLIFDYNEYTSGFIVEEIDELLNLLGFNLESINLEYKRKFNDKSEYIIELLYKDNYHMDIVYLYNLLRSI